MKVVNNSDQMTVGWSTILPAKPNVSYRIYAVQVAIQNADASHTVQSLIRISDVDNISRYICDCACKYEPAVMNCDNTLINEIDIFTHPNTAVERWLSFGCFTYNVTLFYDEVIV